MSPFIVMALTGIAAGLLVPAFAMAAARLGICEPFSLRIAGQKWTFAKKQRTSSANTAVLFEYKMHADHAYPEYARHSSANSVTSLAA